MSRNAAWSACCIAALLAVACNQHAEARSSDRNKPMLIDAGQSSGALDDSTPTVLSQGVTIDQGTLHIEATKAVLNSDGGEVSRAVLTGSPAQLEQELDDGTPMTAVANRIDYDMRTEVVVMTGDVFIKQPRNSLRSDRVVYNMRTGQVTSGGEDAGRVHMRILPKNTGGDTGDQAAAPAERTGDVAVGEPEVAPREQDVETDEAGEGDEPSDETGSDDESTGPAEGR